jgi:acetyl-CoA carboxylase biotin carboxyl carrier protein
MAEDRMSNDSPNGKHHEGDVAFIQSLAELLNSSDLSELSVKREYGEHDRLTVSLSKQGKQITYAAPAPAGPVPSAAPAAQLPAISEDPANLPGAVTSPMVGTAYLSAEPGAAPFVQIGQTVAEGDTLLIVEAMKTMNQIPSPRAGTVKRILIDDGSPVEFGAPLMVVE